MDKYVCEFANFVSRYSKFIDESILKENAIWQVLTPIVRVDIRNVWGL